MKNFNVFGVHGKIRFLRGEVHKKPTFRGGYLKRGAWTVCRFKGRGEAWQKREGGVFEGG